MEKRIAGLLLCMIAALAPGQGLAFPGVLQLASRAGFWANDFPDTAILLQHFYYYEADSVWDNRGDDADIQTIHITGSFTRLVRPWHFGENQQFQYILEGIVPMYNISGEEEVIGPDLQPAFTKSGLGHPMVYTSLGWNNQAKTTHLQGALIWQAPLGDNDLMRTLGFGNNHSMMPLVAVEQRMGNLWLDASMGYWYNFEDLDTDEKQRDYFELNGALSYRLSAPLPWWVYVQSDYTKYREGENAAGTGLDNDGFNWAVAPGVGVAIRPNMTLDLKYEMDVDGESTLDGNAFNLRFLWVL